MGNQQQQQAPTLCGVCISECVCVLECVKGGYFFLLLLFINAQMKDVKGEGGIKRQPIKSKNNIA